MIAEEFVPFAQADNMARTVTVGSFGSCGDAKTAKVINRGSIKFLLDACRNNNIYFNVPSEYLSDVAGNFFKDRHVFPVAGRGEAYGDVNEKSASVLRRKEIPYRLNGHSRRDWPARTVQLFLRYLLLINFPYLFSNKMI